MPRISVVLPIYNVEAFLEPCLESLAGQTVGDFEAVMVDDGSTDSSAAIAAAFAARDQRFRLVSQPNGGLSKARNTGLDHTAGGEFLHFLDSDDLLPLNAYELLLEALEETGSDFATGNVHRLTRRGTSQTQFLRGTFAEKRLRTHITRDRPLLADRTAWNKLFRRAFWDAHGYRFPEGRVHEDIPVILPAHFQARAVDVIAEPVYYYRLRQVGGLSITQRRREPKVLLDRLQALEDVIAFLDEHGPKEARRWYEESIVADDLRYFVDALEGADEEYRALFLDRVNHLLDRISPKAFEPLTAIERLKWALVRRRAMPELLEVRRFQREELKETPPVIIGGRAYGDYPFRGDERLNLPRDLYKLRQELTVTARLDGLELQGDEIRLRGWSFIDGIGAAEPRAQKLTLVALKRGRLRRLRYVTSGLRLKVRQVARPEATATDGVTADATWSGFEATLNRRRLRGTGTWDLFVTVKAGRERRRRMRWFLEGAKPIQALELPSADGALARAGTAETNEVVFEVLSGSAVLRGHRLDDEVAELLGELHGAAEGKIVLEARRRDGSERRRTPVELAADGTWTARLPLTTVLGDVRGAARPDDEDATLGDDPDEAEELETDANQSDDAEPDAPEPWDLFVVAGKVRRRLAMPAAIEGTAWPVAGHEVALYRTAQGDASLQPRRPSAVLEEARWLEDGTLELTGTWPSSSVGPQELVLQLGRRSEQRVIAVGLDPAGDRFTARLTPGAMPTLGGALPLAEGWWGLYTHPPGDHHDERLVHVVLHAPLVPRLPIAATIGHKPFALGMRPNGGVVIVSQRDLGGDERGRFNQRRLRLEAYEARRTQPLRDAVVYSSFRGRQYSDNPRMIHEELVRRGAPLEHLWVVKDGQAVVPDTARVLRDGSREYHEALATARYVVFNDHFPAWFTRRPDQVALQTWHGTPLKQLGLDVSRMRQTVRRFEHRWTDQASNWQYVVSPNRFTTPILRRAYAIEGEMLETGYPRNDVLVPDGLAERTAALRARLGLPDGKRVVLYAPTYRDQVVDRRGRHRLDLQLDVERLRDAVGEDTVILFRKHHYVVDAAPETPDGFVRDVSAYPDGTELLLAADVLVTDYSSMMFDFANTGRPMLFFTYDLEGYRDAIRGFYFDFLARAPGPLLATSDEVAEALGDLDGVRARYAERYAAFAAEFCALDDGRAAARVVDRVFGP